MAEVAPVAAAAPAPAKPKAAKKKSAPKKTGPSVGDLILQIVAASKEKKGMSLAAIKKALAAGGYDVEKNKARIKVAIRSLVAKGLLVQIKGTGASGSFKVGKTEEKAKKPAKKASTKTAPAAKTAVAAKKPAAKKTKAAAAKKSVAAKKAPKKPAAAKKTAKSLKVKASGSKKAAKKVPAKKLTKKPSAKVSKPKVKRAAAKKK